MALSEVPTKLRKFSWRDIDDLIDQAVLTSGFRPLRIIAIARGGIYPAQRLALLYNIGPNSVYVRECSTYEKGVKVREAQFNPNEFPHWMNAPDTLVVDDILDTGATLTALRAILPRANYLTLVRKVNSPDLTALNVKSIYQVGANEWVQFPWESASESPEFLVQDTGLGGPKHGAREAPSVPQEQPRNPQVVSKWSWTTWSDKLHAWFMTKMGIFDPLGVRGNNYARHHLDAKTAELVFLALEYGGEVGEALNFVKKLWRDGFKDEFVQGFVKELADSRIILHHLEDWVKAYVTVRGDEFYTFDGDQNAADKLKELFERWPHIAEAIGYTKKEA